MGETEVMVKLNVRAVKILEEALRVMPYTREELIASGVVARAVERIVELKRRGEELSGKYVSIEKLEEKIGNEGVSPSDHTLYNDLIEWRTAKHEVERLTRFLERI